MKIAYFDCRNGISGNMIIGALIDAGVPFEYLKSEVQKLLQNEKYKFYIEGIQHFELNALYFDVVLPPHKPNIKFEDVPRRTLQDIIKLIKESRLEEDVKTLTIEIFKRLGQAEARAHKCNILQIDFHEDGAIDTIIDIVCSVIGLKYLGVEEIYASPLHVGSGTIKYRYGLLPIPAPATLELLDGIPYYSTEVRGELVTPTGAAIITTLAKEFKTLGNMNIESIGYGAATSQSPISAWLSVIIGCEDIKADTNALKSS